MDAEWRNNSSGKRLAHHFQPDLQLFERRVPLEAPRKAPLEPTARYGQPKQRQNRESISFVIQENCEDSHPNVEGKR
uniref:Uncharacterized protein n=1 Tax=Steinernema glaseri TaxID=37863 RepID=A0A1I7ZSR2_9BILA